MPNGKLTPKQRAFVAEYLIDLNATQAAIRAGYSAKNAHKIGPKLVGKSRIAEAIGIAIEEREERTEITQDWVVRRLREEANFRGEGSTHSARVRSLELLGKHTGMFSETVQVGGDPENPVKVEHSGGVGISLFDRLGMLTGAFARAAHREEAGAVSANGVGESLDSRHNQNGHNGKAG